VEPGGLTTILLTPAVKDDRTGRAKEFGVQACLIKPVLESSLRECVLAACSEPERQQGNLRIEAEGKVANPPLRILVADDVEVNQKLATSLLRKQGHSVVAVSDGQEAVELYKHEVFDLVLLDIEMPGMGGIEAACQVRILDRSAGRRTPIIALTARAMKGDAQDCIAAGMDGYITKPVDPDKLCEAIASVTGPGALHRSPLSVRTSGLIDEWEERAVFDRQELLQQLDGDIDFAQELAGSFLTNCAGHLARMHDAFSDGDCAALREEAHAFKGALANLRARRAQEAARMIEQMARAGDLTHASEAFTKLRAEIEVLKASLASVLDSPTRT